MNHACRNSRGFTLIELSIVLVIIGLIVGGVLVGRDLIKAAELRSQIVQIEKLNTAYTTFRGKHGALPGDITVQSATAFGFYVHASCANGSWSCMDGNGSITSYASASCQYNYSGSLIPVGCGYVGTVVEPILFLQHLNQAGLIEDKISITNPCCEPGQAYVPLKIGKGGIVPITCTFGEVCYFMGVATVSGAGTHFLNTNATQGSMAVDQAKMMDGKVDDGLPNSGRMQATYIYSTWGIYLDNEKTTCTVANVDGIVNYNTANKAALCQLVAK